MDKEEHYKHGYCDGYRDAQAKQEKTCECKIDEPLAGRVSLEPEGARCIYCKLLIKTPVCRNKKTPHVALDTAYYYDPTRDVFRNIMGDTYERRK